MGRSRHLNSRCRQRIDRVPWRPTSAHPASTEVGNALLQPFDLPVERADPLLEFGLKDLALVVVAAAAGAEQELDDVNGLVLP